MAPKINTIHITEAVSTGHLAPQIAINYITSLPGYSAHGPPSLRTRALPLLTNSTGDHPPQDTTCLQYQGMLAYHRTHTQHGERLRVQLWTLATAASALSQQLLVPCPLPQSRAPPYGHQFEVLFNLLDHRLQVMEITLLLDHLRFQLPLKRPHPQ